jgi:propionyl-CoA synthetase
MSRQSPYNPEATEIEKEIVALVREKIGAVAAFKIAITMARLLKTRSGKILRGTKKKIADGDQWTMRRPSTTRRSWGEIGSALKGHGIGG